MLRSSLIVAAAGLLCGVGAAQQQLSPSNIHPIPGAVKHAGTYDVTMKRWLSPDRAETLRASSIMIYDNTCTWTGGGFYTGTGNCEDYFGDGRIPGGVGNANNPVGSSVDNEVNFFEMGYCTAALNGTVDIKVGFYDSLGGNCLGAIAPTPPSLASQAAGFFDFGAAAGFPLPGSATAGVLACWFVNFTNFGFCLQSDADGFYDNSAALDNFAWSFQMENPSGAPANGIILSGEPGTSPVGGCTYNIPCGTDALYGNPCGHGLGQDDAFWVNVDNDLPGNTSNTGVVCVSAPVAGTNCYWFGGHPGNPYSGFYMKIGSAGSCAGCDGSPVNYCTPGTTANGCLSTLALTSGVPSANLSAPPAVITASNVEGAKQGLLFFGYNQSATPWGLGSSSFLCVKSPTQRSPVGNSGGTFNQCDGVLSANLNGIIQAGGGILLGQAVTAGTVIHGQAWFRDPASPKSTSLSNGLSVTVCP